MNKKEIIEEVFNEICERLEDEPLNPIMYLKFMKKDIIRKLYGKDIGKTLKEKIPKGLYCYSGARAPGSKNYKLCPYYSSLILEDRIGEIEIPFCNYLGRGGFDNYWKNDEPERIEKILGKGVFDKDGFLGLDTLWDQTKMCGINVDIEDKLSKKNKKELEKGNEKIEPEDPDLIYTHEDKTTNNLSLFSFSPFEKRYEKVFQLGNKYEELKNEFKKVKEEIREIGEINEWLVDIEEELDKLGKSIDRIKKRFEYMQSK